MRTKNNYAFQPSSGFDGNYELRTKKGNRLTSIHFGAFSKGSSRGDFEKSKKIAHRWIISQQDSWQRVAVQIGRPDFQSLDVVETR